MAQWSPNLDRSTAHTWGDLADTSRPQRPVQHRLGAGRADRGHAGCSATIESRPARAAAWSSSTATRISARVMGVGPEARRSSGLLGGAAGHGAPALAARRLRRTLRVVEL